MAFRGIESVSRKTNHETSERLQDLHPYFSEDNLKNFAGEVHRDQVERAFGLRAIEKLADLSRYPELSKEGRATTLRIVVALTSSQEEKQLAIKSGLIQSCTELLGDDDDFDFLGDTDENATKLDLAKAYIDMGDAEGARDILQEVVSEGNAQQQQEARDLLAQVG